MTRGHLLALLAAVAVVLAGCGGEGSTINDQMRQGDQKGYVAGDGTIQVLAPEERETVITLEGTTLEDEAWSSQDHLGEVVVVNVWGSWCGPCVEEAPDLEEVATEFAEAGEPVQFIGGCPCRLPSNPLPLCLPNAMVEGRHGGDEPATRPPVRLYPLLTAASLATIAACRF